MRSTVSIDQQHEKEKEKEKKAAKRAATNDINNGAKKRKFKTAKSATYHHKYNKYYDKLRSSKTDEEMDIRRGWRLARDYYDNTGETKQHIKQLKSKLNSNESIQISGLTDHISNKLSGETNAFRYGFYQYCKHLIECGEPKKNSHRHTFDIREVVKAYFAEILCMLAEQHVELTQPVSCNNGNIYPEGTTQTITTNGDNTPSLKQSSSAPESIVYSSADLIAKRRNYGSKETTTTNQNKTEFAFVQSSFTSRTKG